MKGLFASAATPSFPAVLRFEWVKLVHRRLTWAPFLILLVMVGIIVAVFHHFHFQHAMAMFQRFGKTFAGKQEFVNGFYLAAHSMKPAFEMLLPIFLAVAAGLSVAGEAELGTLRACLVRPVRRRTFLLAKFCLLGLYALALSMYYLGLIISAGLLNFGSGDLYTINILFHNGEYGFSLVPAEEAPLRFLLAGLIATLGMLTLVSLALLISALVETAAMAYVLTLSIYFTELTLRVLPFLDWLYPYLFVTHMVRWEQCFYEHVKTGEILVSLVHLAAYLVVFLAGAMLLFEERDIKT